MSSFAKYILLACIAIHAVAANKVVVYWGQNSVGNEGDLRDYCASSSVDIVVIGFVYEFPVSSYPGATFPGTNFANHCWRTFNSANPYFLNCTDSIAPDITYCQSLGKQVLLSFGGAVGNYGFSSNAQAQTFATTVWNMFLGGSNVNVPRPFGNAIIDGIDLDIEAHGTTGYAAFITQLRSYFTAQTARTYYISGAPQCVYPDAMMGPGAGTALGDAWFDYVWVQFYNNYCGVNYYPSEFNFNVWANWAASSKNPNVKVFIGAPGSQSAAGQGYVSAATLQIISNAVAATFPTNYGGIMLWDAGTAKANGDFAGQLASFVHTASSSSGTISTPTTPTTPVATPTAPVVTPSAPTPVAPTPVQPAPVQPQPVQPQPVQPQPVQPQPQPLTTGRAKTLTPAVAPTPASSTSTSAKASTSTSTSSTSSSSSNACSVDGHMRCAGASSYQTCTHGLWSVTQNCAASLKCSPSGDYIYCVR